MMQTSRKYLTVLLACVLSFVLILPMGVSAADDVDTGADTSLTITFMPDETPAVGVNFELYRVADLVGEDEYELTGRFAEYPVEMTLDTTEEMRLLASTLQAFVVTDELVSDFVTDKTDADGVVSFTGLTTGLYLAVGDVFLHGEQYYFPTPFLVKLPDKNTDGVWEYDIQVTTKHTFRPNDGTKIELDVMKVWNDGDSENRPEEITVDLYEGKLYYDSVTLSKANNWRYTWTELDAGAIWTVVEAEVPEGYTVTIEQVEDTTIITNTGEPEEPTSSTPSEPGSSEPTPSQPDAPSSTTPSKPGDKLPQTGMLWWPVLALTAGGLVLIIAGLIRRRGASSEK